MSYKYFVHRVHLFRLSDTICFLILFQIPRISDIRDPNKLRGKRSPTSIRMLLIPDAKLIKYFAKFARFESSPQGENKFDDNSIPLARTLGIKFPWPLGTSTIDGKFDSVNNR